MCVSYKFSSLNVDMKYQSKQATPIQVSLSKKHHNKIGEKFYRTKKIYAHRRAHSYVKQVEGRNVIVCTTLRSVNKTTTTLRVSEVAAVEVNNSDRSSSLLKVAEPRDQLQSWPIGCSQGTNRETSACKQERPVCPCACWGDYLHGINYIRSRQYDGFHITLLFDATLSKRADRTRTHTHAD